jgi:hypothetical protein
MAGRAALTLEKLRSLIGGLGERELEQKFFASRVHELLRRLFTGTWFDAGLGEASERRGSAWRQ